MTTKSMAMNAKVDWDYVSQVTEVPRTYEITTHDGRHFFKMYKPSEAKRICKAKKWLYKLVGSLERKY